jgi:hypothetical protein
LEKQCGARMALLSGFVETRPLRGPTLMARQG